MSHVAERNTQTDEYTGNIIFNLPYAKYIVFRQYEYNSSISTKIPAGSLVAPNAQILMNHYSSRGGYINGSYRTTLDSKYVGNIIADSIYNGNMNNYRISNFVINSHIKATNYKLSKKVVQLNSGAYREQPKDYDDDMYSRDYSIKDLLENYNVVTLGKKAIDTKSKLLNYGSTPGSIKLFHITGPALIAGDALYSTATDRTAFDLESNEVAESYIKGNIRIDTSQGNSYCRSTPVTVVQPFDSIAYDRVVFTGKYNNLLVHRERTGECSGIGNYTGILEDHLTYINFDRLYDNIVAEQSAIEKGVEVEPNGNKIAHVTIGGNIILRIFPTSTR